MIISAVETSEKIAIYTSVSGLVGLPFTSLLSFFFYFIEVQQELSLLLFLNIDLPLNMEEMLMKLKNFQLNSFLPEFFRKNSTVNNIYDDQIAPTKFKKANFSSSFLGNGFSVFLLAIILPIFFYFVFFVIEKFEIKPRIFSLEKRRLIRIYLFYNFSLSLFFSGSLELSLFIALQLNNVSFYNLFNGMSFFLALFTLGYMIASPIFLLSKMKDIEKKIKQNPKIEFSKVVNLELESIFIDLNLQNGIYFPLLRIIKKILVSFIQVFCYSNYMLQIILRIVLAITFLIYYKQFEPFKYKIFNAIYEYTELGIALLLGLLLLYYKASPNDFGNNIALILGIVCILLLIFLIVINSFLMIFPMIYRIILLLKQKYMNKQNENEESNTSRALLVNNERNNSVELIKMAPSLKEKNMIDVEAECHFLEEELTITKRNHEKEKIDREKRYKTDLEKVLNDQSPNLNQRESQKIKKTKDNTTNTNISIVLDFDDKFIFEHKPKKKKNVDAAVNTIITRFPDLEKNMNSETKPKKPPNIFKKVEGWDLYYNQIEEGEIESESKIPHASKNL